MNMKPLVGVMPLWDERKQSLWMLPGYMEGLVQAGAIPIIFPLSENASDLSALLEMCQGILFTGGQDVSPRVYGETPLNDSVSCCPQRDRMESIILDLAIEANKSVLGICRGIQFINAALGGTLYQDLPLQHPSNIDHHQKPPYDVPAHGVHLQPRSPIYSLLGKEDIRVNSYHHQAIKNIAPKLDIMGVSDDNLIEAVYMPDKKFFWAVQWHPEFDFHKNLDDKKIFDAFVSSML
jgi:putative glutamine amidotransferase